MKGYIVAQAEKIGLLRPLHLLEGHSWPWTFVWCMIISPVGMIVIGLVGELRLVPLDPRVQFWGFMPGDIFFGLATATFIVAAQHGSRPESLYRRYPWIHWVVFGAAVLFAAYMTVNDYVSGAYPFWAVFSPTKFFHNGALYGGYAYVMVMSVFATVTDLVKMRDRRTLILLLLGLGALTLWCICLQLDYIPRFLGQLPPSEKAAHAHLGNWYEAWVLLFTHH